MSEYLIDPYNCPMRYDKLDIVKKCRPKAFIYWKFGLFFKNFCFQQPLRCYRNNLVTSKKFVRDFCGPLQIVAWGSSHSIMRERIGQNLFFAGRLPYFSENCVYNNLLGPKKRSYNFHSNCQNTLWTLADRSLRFITLDNARKNRSKSFLRWKIALIFENLCLQQPLRS